MKVGKVSVAEKDVGVVEDEEEWALCEKLQQRACVRRKKLLRAELEREMEDEGKT